ncbi:type II secretion system F family protein [Schlesneria paludicola]|uniref:type II secretion system F family protein n=1 Tax=Schlesneria paludicola TaxID=360056 RepID=UPI00029B1EB9|nr:type II secretion system F family protein [Schlesneria paludicola]
MARDTNTLKTPLPFAGILKDEEIYGTGRGDDAADQINSWFDDLMLQSGMPIAPSALLALCLCSGVALGGIVLVAHENLLTTALGTIVGFILPVIVAMIVRTRRQDTMMRQIPSMLEELARAAKTGRSVEQSLEVVSADTPSPLGDELKLAAGRLKMGVQLKEALRDLPHRTGLMTLSLLCTTLTVQQQTGGDLVTVLERLSRTVRDRMSFLGRLRAATAASRATAILMIVLPPAVLAFFIARKPTYLHELLSSPWGRNATILAVTLELIGALWVMRILKTSQQT